MDNVIFSYAKRLNKHKKKVANVATNFPEVEQDFAETCGVGNKRKIKSEHQDGAKKQHIENGTAAVLEQIKSLLNINTL